MTKEEFSEKLVECREEAKVSKVQIAKAMGFMIPQLNRIEKCKVNYTMDNVFKYLNIFHYVIECYSEELNMQFRCSNRQEFAEKFKDTRKELGITINTIRDNTGLSNAAISTMETLDTNIKIESFLKCLDGIGFKVRFVPLEN